jgi:hypothetical protein
VAIAALVVWLLTAAAGMALLVRGNAARRESAVAAARSAPARPVPAPVPGAGRGPDGEMPDIPRVKVHATPGEHPLQEFSHPALGLVGLGLWFIYLGTHHQPLAWVSFGVLVVTIAAGLSWLIRSARPARGSEGGPRRVFPARMVLLHGLLATATVLLAVLTALAASR